MIDIKDYVKNKKIKKENTQELGTRICLKNKNKKEKNMKKNTVKLFLKNTNKK